jgi:large subunit ribosomal protein L31
MTKEQFVNEHPVLHHVDVRCASCGSSFAVRSTAAAIAVDVCATCHPAYTGRERTLAAGSRIDRFNRRRELAAA